MSSFAIFRLPFAQSCTLMVQEEGEPEELNRLTSLNDRQGYVFAPFAATSNHPVLLLTPSRVETMDCKKVFSVCSTGILSDYEFPNKLIFAISMRSFRKVHSARLFFPVAWIWILQNRSRLLCFSKKPVSVIRGCLSL